MVQIPEQFNALFEQPVIFNLATLMPDGQLQVTPVWGDRKDGNLRINTAVGRQKDKNLLARPQVTVLLVDPQDPFNWIELRCRVADRTTEGAEEHIDQLAKKYLNVDVYPGHTDTETRVTYVFEPVKINHS